MNFYYRTGYRAQVRMAKIPKTLLKRFCLHVYQSFVRAERSWTPLISVCYRSCLRIRHVVRDIIIYCPRVTVRTIYKKSSRGLCLISLVEKKTFSLDLISTSVINSNNTIDCVSFVFLISNRSSIL